MLPFTLRFNLQKIWKWRLCLSSFKSPRYIGVSMTFFLKPVFCSVQELCCKYWYSARSGPCRGQCVSESHFYPVCTSVSSLFTAVTLSTFLICAPNNFLVVTCRMFTLQAIWFNCLFSCLLQLPAVWFRAEWDKFLFPESPHSLLILFFHGNPTSSGKI